MAGGIRAVSRINRTTTLGLIALGVVVCLTLGTLGVVALYAEDSSALASRDWSAIRFTLWQAALSALISVTLAIPVARALARRSFPGRATLVTLLGAPFILPVMVAVLGLISVFGRKGILSQTLIWAGLEPVSIYGYHGVILAHVFFNLPLATRLILQGWLAIPAERFRLAASLGMGPRDIFRTLERPMLREVLPGAFLVIFLICLTSFAVVLALGGGPKATTVELAIYEAFRFDFDLGRAAKLALVQFALGAVAAFVAFRVSIPHDSGAGLDRAVLRWDDGAGQKLLDIAAITLATLFLILPLSMILANGLPGLWSLPQSVWLAAARSLMVALGSAALTLLIALPIAALAVRRGSRLVEGVGYLTIAASPLVIGTGLFIMIFPFLRPSDLALPVTALVNAAMSLPFALRVLTPALASVERDYGALADGLGLTGRARLRLLWLPRLRRPIGFALGLAAALSMGDLGVIAMFAAPDNATLPLQLYRLMGAYRMADAAAAAVLLLGLSLLLFWIFDRGGRVDADR
ncbi:thiamine/thiamine pyrophosphate ABC transporter permease ThiP [Aliiroseovarius crassostreae]|uniref:Thiamine/thiamine pyrophosphate ABC transporter permease ThiP n=1 Tax=Aliiroseovarius crassostreae TaxID=154981 RepID=A0A9Q9LTL8_9RHOB|nr:thiamine/thiamine pyrophosphate ABC transporter permease ThiP [Aliiroseovarius crassostreae]UWP95370.1 thiamine/thiamine pyrophosphate ABC transporter permease ThiP [Aliiroseovarius crassostreae]